MCVVLLIQMRRSIPLSCLCAKYEAPATSEFSVKSWKLLMLYLMCLIHVNRVVSIPSHFVLSCSRAPASSHTQMWHQSSHLTLGKKKGWAASSVTNSNQSNQDLSPSPPIDLLPVRKRDQHLKQGFTVSYIITERYLKVVSCFPPSAVKQTSNLILDFEVC